MIKRKNIDNSTIICLAGALAYIGSALVGNSFIFTAPFFFIFLGLANNSGGQYPAYPEQVEKIEEITEISGDDSDEGEPAQEELLGQDDEQDSITEEKNNSAVVN